MLESITPVALRKLGLSPREAEVLRWTAQGMANAEIAASLHISTPTVKKHLERIFRKLGVSNRLAAVVKVAQSCTARRPASSRCGPGRTA